VEGEPRKGNEEQETNEYANPEIREIRVINVR